MISASIIGSTAIEQLNYDEDKGELSIVFKGQSGMMYTFFEVPPIVFQNFCVAPSAGQFYHQYVKGKYVQRVVADGEESYRGADAQ